MRGVGRGISQVVSGGCRLGRTFQTRGDVGENPTAPPTDGKEKKMSLIQHAETELKLAGLFDKDSDYGGMLGDSVMELIKVFSEQGHSGCSASMVSNLFDSLSRFKQITPLTLKDDEWNEFGEGMFQNKRRSSVFKDGKDGRAYFIDAYYKKTQTGSTLSGSLDLKGGTRVSKCYIKDVKSMPTICIDVIETEVSKDNWDMVIKDMEQLNKLKEHYDLEISPPILTKG